jgi:sugar O-acyltransferase (sialic acid O-acetyltransferase NeuD family)
VRSRRQAVLIIGAAGHGRVAADILELGRFRVAGFIDSRWPIGTLVAGHPILGEVAEVPSLCRKHRIDALFVAVGDNWQRARYVRSLSAAASKVPFASAVHPSAQIAKSARIGCGVAIMAGAILNPGVEVKDFCIVNTKASLDHDSTMNEFGSLAPGVTLGGNVQIGRFSAVGIGCCVREKVTVGESAVVGAGAVVLDDIPDRVVAYGNPARVVRSRTVADPYLRR